MSTNGSLYPLSFSTLLSSLLVLTPSCNSLCNKTLTEYCSSILCGQLGETIVPDSTPGRVFQIP